MKWFWKHAVTIGLIIAGIGLGLDAYGRIADVRNTDTEQSVSAISQAESNDGSVIDDIEDVVFGSYEDILEEYSKKLSDAVPGLVEEFNEEAKDNQDGLTGLATICNDKVGELAKICNDGVQEMAKIYMKKGSGEYSEYEEWAGKLQGVYAEEAGKIQDAYMDYATN